MELGGLVEYIKKTFTRKDLGGSSVLRLHPITCWHIGARQSDIKFILAQIKEIHKDPAARWIYMGDGGECVTKLSKGNVFLQTLSLQEQQNFLAFLMEPIKDKALWGIRGNHGNRVDKETGLGFDESLMHRLGIPYRGISALGPVRINRSNYSVYTHHGVDSGVSLQGKVNAAKKHYHILADLRLTGHSHVAMDLPPEVYRYADPTSCTIRKQLSHQCITGSAYDSTVEGYADEKAYPPLLPQRLRITLDGRITAGTAHKNIEVYPVRSNGAYDTAAESKKLQTAWEFGNLKVV
jgi:hypothetical protein